MIHNLPFQSERMHPGCQQPLHMLLGGKHQPSLQATPLQQLSGYHHDPKKEIQKNVLSFSFLQYWISTGIFPCISLKEEESTKDEWMDSWLNGQMNEQMNGKVIDVGRKGLSVLLVVASWNNNNKKSMHASHNAFWITSLPQSRAKLPVTK